MLISRLEEVLQQRVCSCRKLFGGCITTTQRIQTESGHVYFLKSGGVSGMFSKEANGLLEIAASKAIDVPRIIACTDDFLLLSFIEKGQISQDFFRKFAEQFAAMHAQTSSSFGFYEDNFIGNTLQLNCATEKEKNDWATFFFNKRLKFQFELAERNGYVKLEMSKLFASLEEKIETILGGSQEPPSLLHGDLWGGNYMVGKRGQAVLIDPAVYYGHREADLAMTRLFGGFPAQFYDVYQEVNPLPEGWEFRENIYHLYHVLNHLNMFGMSYYQEAVSLMDYYV